MLEEGVVDQALAEVVVDLLGEHKVNQQFVHQRNVGPLGVGEHFAVFVVVATGMDHLEVRWREMMHGRDVRKRSEQVDGDHIQSVLEAFRVVEEGTTDDVAISRIHAMFSETSVSSIRVFRFISRASTSLAWEKSKRIPQISSFLQRSARR